MRKGAFLAFLLLAPLGYSLAVRSLLEGFEYPQARSAREEWKPQGESPPVGIAPHRTEFGTTALKLPCPFSKVEERCYWDKEVSLDLSRFDEFRLSIKADRPEALSLFSIYFRSGDGWFAFGVKPSKDWRAFSLRKAEATIEGTPTGWHKIDRIRLSAWKRLDKEATVFVDDLLGVRHDIVVVLGDLTLKAQSPESRAVLGCARRISRLLEGLGIEFGLLTDTDVEAGALQGRKLAIFAYNPNMSEAEVQKVEEFMNAGGKVILFYSLPQRLASLLGLRKLGYTRPTKPGEFSKVRFRPGALYGLPDEILQNSWNIEAVEPEREDVLVVGDWADPEGNLTGKVAVVIGPRGAFMTHILTAGDPQRKSQFLVALMGALLPEVWGEAAKGALKSLGRSAGFQNIEEFVDFICKRAPKVANGPRAIERLNKALTMRGEALSALRDGQFLRALLRAREADALLGESFLFALPSRRREFRAVWCHSAYGVPGMTWEEAIRLLKENGFNAVFPNMLWAGRAYYPSEVLPVMPEVEERGDAIAQCLTACRKYGVEIHIWKVNWNLAGAPDQFIRRLREEGRLQVDANGNEVRWLCPSHPQNFKLELESMLEVARKYPVDGLHFDYIRYPHSNSCYCQGCRERFERWLGRRVEKWPEDVISGPLASKYREWRRLQITRLVEAVSREARRIRPGIRISAAVFRNWPQCRDTIGQDWAKWVEEGYLDFVCPMNYTADDTDFEAYAKIHMKAVRGRAPLIEGVGASARELPPEQVARQIEIARKVGADGFIIFNFDRYVADQVLPALRKGITALDPQWDWRR